MDDQFHPLCINCEHHIPRSESAGTNIDWCHASVGHLDLVTGQKTYEYCFVMRRSGKACGPKGDLFTPKPTYVRGREDIL
jgi:hypothetical protein